MRFYEDFREFVDNHETEISRDIHSDHSRRRTAFLLSDGLLAIKHIKRGMPMITDGWRKLAEEQP